MSLRFLHLADLHLGARFPMLGPREAERQADLLRAFDRAVGFALDPAHRIDAVLVAGDVFDVPDPGPRIAGHVRAQAARLTEAGLPVFWIPGTHDGYDEPHCVYRQEPLPGVTLFTDPQYGAPVECTIRDRRVAVSGFAWQAGRTPQGVLATLPDPGPDVLHVALLHGSVQASLDWTVQDHYVPVAPEALARAPVHYLALGHYHSARQYPTARGIAYYPGTLEGRRFGENGARLLAVAEVGPDGARVETHRWNARTLRDEVLDLDTAGFADADGIVDWLRARADRDAICRVILRGAPDAALDADRLAERAADGYFHLSLRDETAVFESGWIADFAEEESVRGAFVRRLQDRLRAAAGPERAAVALALKLGVQAFAGHAGAAD